MRLPKSVSSILVKKNSKLKKFLQSDDSLVVKLKKSIYGLKQAAERINQLFANDLPLLNLKSGQMRFLQIS